MTNSQNADDALVERTAAGDETALAALFDQNRARLRQIVRLRLDWRLRGRVDPSDVLQEAYLDLAKQLPAYCQTRSLPLFLWMRHVACQRLMRIHRQHLGAQMRDAARDVPLDPNGTPEATSASIAAHLLDHCAPASQAAVQAETHAQLQEALTSMDEMDREVIALRNFEELDNRETAEVLGISAAAARERYVRSLKRLQHILERFPGLLEEWSGRQ